MVAMGRRAPSGREAADLVLLDDDFATIVAAVEQGRWTFRTSVASSLTIYRQRGRVTPFVLWALSGAGSRSRSGCCRCWRSTSQRVLPAHRGRRRAPPSTLLERPPRAPATARPSDFRAGPSACSDRPKPLVALTAFLMVSSRPDGPPANLPGRFTFWLLPPEPRFTAVVSSDRWRSVRLPEDGPAGRAYPAADEPLLGGGRSWQSWRCRRSSSQCSRSRTCSIRRFRCRGSVVAGARDPGSARCRRGAEAAGRSPSL